MYRTTSFGEQNYQKANHYKNKDNSMRAQWDRQNTEKQLHKNRTLQKIEWDRQNKMWERAAILKGEGPRQNFGGEGSINTYQRQKPLGNTLSFGSLGRGGFSNHNVQDNNLYAERYGKNLNSLGRYKNGNQSTWSASFSQSPALQQMFHNASSMLRDGIQDGERDRLDNMWRDMSGTGGGSFGGSQRKGLSLDNLF